MHVILRHERERRRIVQPKYRPHVSSEVDAVVFVAGCRLLAQQCRDTVLADVAIAHGLCFIKSSCVKLEKKGTFLQLSETYRWLVASSPGDPTCEMTSPAPALLAPNAVSCGSWSPTKMRCQFYLMRRLCDLACMNKAADVHALHSSRTDACCRTSLCAGDTANRRFLIVVSSVKRIQAKHIKASGATAGPEQRRIRRGVGAYRSAPCGENE